MKLFLSHNDMKYYDVFTIKVVTEKVIKLNTNETASA